jgi:hypothetical protein
MLLCTGHDAWIRHGQGISTLFLSQGPEVCKDNHVFELLRSSRFLIILSSLASRRLTFLSEPSWDTVPWQRQNAAKDSMDSLLDMMCEVPSLRSTLSTLHDIAGTADTNAVTYHTLAEDATDSNSISTFCHHLSNHKYKVVRTRQLRISVRRGPHCPVIL